MMPNGTVNAMLVACLPGKTARSVILIQVYEQRTGKNCTLVKVLACQWTRSAPIYKYGGPQIFFPDWVSAIMLLFAGHNATLRIPCPLAHCTLLHFTAAT